MRNREVSRVRYMGVFVGVGHPVSCFKLLQEFQGGTLENVEMAPARGGWIIYITMKRGSVKHVPGVCIQSQMRIFRPVHDDDLL